jgi:hypothetical protein
MPTADNMPDFDSMSPEEIMAWMETLAKRQGATEGLTTAANMEIAEIDPSTVVIDEPGYVPYGQESKKTTEQKAAAPPPAPERPAAPPPAAQQPPPAAQPPRPAAPAPAPARPASQPPPTPLRQPAPPPAQQPPAARQYERPAAQPPPTAPPPAPVRPAAQQPPPPAQPPTPPPAPARPAAPDDNALAWLESLAADQDESLFNLDLSGLSSTPAAADTATDPMAWLENLASNQGGFNEPAPVPNTTTAPAGDPFASGVDPMAWLESLAKRVGTNPDELTTAADIDVPLPTEAATPEFDLSMLSAELEPQEQELENPVNFLDSLASEYNEETILAPSRTPEPSAEQSIDSINEAVAAGTASREQMQQWLEHQTDLYVQEAEQPVEEVDPDAPPLPAELPSWLLDQFGPPPAAEKRSQPEVPQPTQSLEDLFPAPQAAPLPDWLREDSGNETIDLQSIFADTSPQEEVLEAPVDEVSPPVEIVPGDTWAEALDEEYEQGVPDVGSIPDWYERNVNDPIRRAAVEQLETGEAVDPSTVLPVESELPAGQQQPVPDWLAETAPATPPFGTNFAPEVPDWIREAEAAVSLDQIPDWLNETLDEPQIEEFTPAAFAAPAAPPPAPEPAPVRPPAAELRSPVPERQTPIQPRTTAVGSLDDARRLGQSGDIVGALAEYESLIRANVELETVVEDLSKIVSANRSNAAAYRVLGDGLMRQGKLQAALETYRQALNQL